ncbi:hypothetical protein PCANC_17817 [Puccinia coronata f. sp. avenae]|uniref:C-CAP/cofactor C-like domain-containing protein n=1 Tax=Puccinia coronata f. sp. avenae TaxID=200324 RepID=A0A2N5SBL9_9BASI|nr:hypothetical protein PCANC_17817 [Puccinia coronata f. sp. avenae]PLW24184.1 hypothetical protein PCASD_09706 [Puccinia coronata f. sp. avenae]PLW44396.1 hypothetical protein PCASD_04483 [Puccinia coronata f. sp. avenae]
MTSNQDSERGAQDNTSSNQFVELTPDNLEGFETSLKNLEKDLNQIKSHHKLESVDRDRVKELFGRKLDLMHQFNLFINQQTPRYHHGSSFISSFDQQRLLNKLKEIETEISKLQAEDGLDQGQNSAPSKRKKFSFKKTPLSQPALPIPTVSTAPEAQPTPSAVSIPPLHESQGSNPLGLTADSQNLFIQPSCPVQPLHILALSDLSNVVLDLRNLAPHLSTLQLSRIHHAAVLAPPLSGSAFLTHVSHSILLLISQQVRSYGCEDVVLLLHTHTGPVIESCKGIRIAPYPKDLFPPSPSDAFDPARSSSQHHLPHDFDHPEASSTSSPNFSILDSLPIPRDDLCTLFQPGHPLVPSVHSLPTGGSYFLLPESCKDLLAQL